jgi:hypothetical protein
VVEKSKIELEAIRRAFGVRSLGADPSAKSGRGSFRVSMTERQRKQLADQRRAAEARAAAVR